MKLDSPNKDLQDLRDKNLELAQHLQHWKSVASEKEKEKIECLKENKFLRMQVVNQRSKRTTIIENLESVIKELTQHAIDVSNKLVKSIRILEDFQKQCLVTDEDFIYSNSTSSPINNIQLVQPMVQGHSILKPVIALARAVIEIPSEHNQSSVITTGRNTTHPPHLIGNIQVSPRPMAQLLESFVPLQRVDNEVIRISNDFINDRRRHQGSFQDDTSFGEVLDGLEEGVSEMDTTMVNGQSVDFENDNLRNTGSSGTFCSRQNLSQIKEEVENESIIDRTSNSQSFINTSQDILNPKFGLIPLVLIHRNENEKSNQEARLSPRPGPSQQVDSDEDEYYEKIDQRKRGRKKKKRQKSSGKALKCTKDENKTNSKCKSTYNKENFNYNNANSDSDSENSSYNRKLSEMVLTKRVIDSLKPVTVVVNKLNIKEDVSPLLPDINTRRSSNDSIFLENGDSNCSLAERDTIEINGVGNSSSESRRETEGNASFGVNYYGRDSDYISRPSSRSRRTGPKTYKEVPLNKKMRRT